MKEFKDLSVFAKRDVEFYRSNDPDNTGKYFTNDKKPTHFELLFFGHDSNFNRRVYLRYPNTDHFVELVDSGRRSHGNMDNFGAIDIWMDEYRSKINIYKHDTNLMISFGNGDFNFLSKVAYYDNGNPYNNPYPNITKENYNEIEKALSLKYIPLPSDVFDIEYCMSVGLDKHILIAYPKYYNGYENRRAWIVEDDNPREVKITGFERYRDGGTTYVFFVDNGKECKFYSPTSFKPNEPSTLDGIECKKTPELLQNHIIYILGLKTTAPK